MYFQRASVATVDALHPSPSQDRAQGICGFCLALMADTIFTAMTPAPLEYIDIYFGVRGGHDRQTARAFEKNKCMAK